MSALVADPARPELARPQRPAASMGGWGAGAVLVAVAGAFDPFGLRPFTTLRWALVSVLVLVAVGLASGRAPGRRRWEGRCWVGLLAWLAVACAVAADPLTALVGHPRRHLGLVGFGVLAAAWWVGTRLGTDRDRRLVGRAAVVAGLVTGAGVLAVVAGWDSAGVTFAGGRVGGLLGQPSYLGALAVLLAPVGVGVAADVGESAAWRRAGGVAAAGCAAAALASGSRGAWLGAVVAAAVALPHLRRGVRWGRERGGRARTLGGGALVVVGLVVLGAVAGRGTAAFDPSAPGGIGRLDEWQVATRMIADHPLLGVGPEGYRSAAPAHIDDDYARRHGRAEVVDRAHSGPLDVAAAGGVPAGFLYVALVGGTVLRCARVARRRAGPGDAGAATSPVVVGAAVGVVGWAVQQLVSFPTVEVDPAAWLLAGVVLAATTGADAAGAGVGAGGGGGAGGPGGRASANAARRVGAAVGVAVLVVAGVSGVVADRRLERAQRLIEDGDARVAEAVRMADRATELRPDDLDAWYVAARVASSGPSLTAVDAGLDRVEAGLDRSGGDPALRDLHEALLTERALRSLLPDDLTAAEDAARAGIADDPAGPAHHRRLGLVLAARATADTPEPAGTGSDADATEPATTGDATTGDAAEAADDGAGPGDDAERAGEPTRRDAADDDADRRARDRAGAVAALERALALDPEDAVAAEALDRLEAR
jgi:O-antigen ligase